MRIIFFDTCSLMLGQKDVLKKYEIIDISSVTLKELENIKSSGTKSEDAKMQARAVANMIKKNPTRFRVHLYKQSFYGDMLDYDLVDNNDSRIVITAKRVFEENGGDGLFISNDTCCLLTARELGLQAEEFAVEEVQDYTGYKEVYLNTDELAELYGTTVPNGVNKYNLLTNEYLIVYDTDKNLLDKFKWKGNYYEKVPYNVFKSKVYGDIKPKDVYQQLVMDSMVSNDITLISGYPGSGKTMLSFGYLFSQLEKGEIDRIVVFCNPVVAKDAAKLGFYKGTVREKLLASQVGAVLSSKLGGLGEVERLLDEEKLILMPAGDARGYEVPPYSGVYFLEAQNSTVELTKMLLQRIGEKCVTIVDGDFECQTDLAQYSNHNNGMKAMLNAFKGENLFGAVKLNNIYRSKIANIAERMKD